MHDALVAADALDGHLEDPAWVVLDCRFRLDDPDHGERAYRAGHVPGARYAHLDRDLSGPVVPGATGRHPLPEPDALARTFGDWGIGEGTQVVAYDDAGSAIAARVWWLLRWLGHEAVAVLDGGLPAWTASGRPLAAGVEPPPSPRAFVPRPRPELVVDAAAVASALEADIRVLDVRSEDRFRGENETMDPIAGHIPGATSAPFAGNLDREGRFLPAADLRRRYEALLHAPVGAPAPGPIVYCGSGVTAAHAALAMRVAGLAQPRLYAGSWSEWINDPARPVATGPA